MDYLNIVFFCSGESYTGVYVTSGLADLSKYKEDGGIITGLGISLLITHE